MKKIFLILLLLVFNLNLFGQLYFISFENLDTSNYMIDIEWSDGSCMRSYSKSDWKTPISGYYNKKVKKITYYDSGSGCTYTCKHLDNLDDAFTERFMFLYGSREITVVQQAEIAMVLNYTSFSNMDSVYCVSDDLIFYVERLTIGGDIHDINVCIEQYGKNSYYKNDIKSDRFQIRYEDLCEIIEPTTRFYVSFTFNDRFDSTFTVKQNFPGIFQNIKINESDFYVLDSKFYFPKMSDDTEIVLNNVNQGLAFGFDSKYSQSYDLENYYGPYTVYIGGKRKCTLVKSFIYPELKYNYVDKAEQYNFWYSGEEREVVELSLYTRKKLSEVTITPDMNKGTTLSSKILCKTNAGKPDTIDGYEHIYSLSTIDTLSKITITSNKDFIPVTKSVELKSYPKIDIVNIDTIINAVCYYDTAIVKVSGMKGGLDNCYKFKLEKDGKEFWSENSTIKIPATIFGGNEQEVKLYVYDKDSISDDTGREKRAFSTNIKFKYGEKLDIKNWQVADLKCFEDNTGKISISDWTPKNDDIKFEVWKSENKISDSQITENLAAGDYNLKIVDGKDCVNDSFQVVVNQPDKLQTSVKSFEIPLCYGYADGKITTTTIGGTGDYTFLWNNGATTSDIENLNAGIYQLTVTDGNECQTSVSQVLTEPEELKNSLQSSYTICKGNELKIDDGELKTKEGLTYWWHFPNGNIHEDRVLVVTSDMPEGDYIMYTSNSKGCFTKDTTNIKFADNELNIKFLAPTYSYLGDTVVLAEDSEIFTDYTWSYQFNNDMFEDITSSMYNTPKNQTFLKTWAYGTDTITMYANDGHCNASFSKEVNILNEQRSDYSNYEAPSAGIFTRLAIGPSPNDGNFTLYANLSEESELKINLLDVSRSQKIALNYEKNATLSDHYEIPFQGLGLTTGVYCLILTAQGETKQIKFTVK